MQQKPITMKPGNKGLTVKVNLWALEKYLEEFDAESARLWVKGMVTNADTGETKMFNDPGELITILGKWNVAKFKGLQRRATRT